MSITQIDDIDTHILSFLPTGNALYLRRLNKSSKELIDNTTQYHKYIKHRIYPIADWMCIDPNFLSTHNIACRTEYLFEKASQNGLNSVMMLCNQYKPNDRLFEMISYRIVAKCDVETVVWLCNLNISPQTITNIIISLVKHNRIDCLLKIRNKIRISIRELLHYTCGQHNCVDVNTVEFLVKSFRVNIDPDLFFDILMRCNWNVITYIFDNFESDITSEHLTAIYNFHYQSIYTSHDTWFDMIIKHQFIPYHPTLVKIGQLLSPLIQIDYEEAMQFAIYAKNIEQIKWLHGHAPLLLFDPISNKTLIQFAIETGFIELIEYLFEIHPEHCSNWLQQYGNTFSPIQLYYSRTAFDLIVLIHKYCAIPDSLIDHALCCDVRTTEWLIKNKIKYQVNQRTWDHLWLTLSADNPIMRSIVDNIMSISSFRPNVPLWLLDTNNVMSDKVIDIYELTDFFCKNGFTLCDSNVLVDIEYEYEYE